MDFLPSIRSIFDKAVRDTDGRSVAIVKLALGEISDLDQETLQRHWREFAIGTKLEHAQLHIRLITAEVQCMACFSKYHPIERQIHCPHCGGFGAKILSGEEFRLETIETDDD